VPNRAAHPVAEQDQRAHVTDNIPFCEVTHIGDSRGVGREIGGSLTRKLIETFRLMKGVATMTASTGGAQSAPLLPKLKQSGRPA
jgi:hypothetical protein